MVEKDTTDTSYLANTAQIVSDLKVEVDPQFEGSSVNAAAAYDGSIVLSTIRAKTLSEIDGVIQMTAMLDNQGYVKSRYQVSTAGGRRRLLRQLDEINSGNGTDVATWPFELGETTNTVQTYTAGGTDVNYEHGGLSGTTTYDVFVVGMTLQPAKYAADATYSNV